MGAVSEVSTRWELRAELRRPEEGSIEGPHPHFGINDPAPLGHGWQVLLLAERGDDVWSTGTAPFATPGKAITAAKALIEHDALPLTDSAREQLAAELAGLTPDDQLT